MEADFWLERWQQNQIGFHQEDINSHLQQFWGKLGEAKPGKVFVPLCGKSRDMLWLRAQGHKVLGIEVSPIAVEDFFAENDITPRVSFADPFDRWETDGLTILCGDFFDLEPSDVRSCSSVYDRASLVALPTSMRAKYAKHFGRLVPASAKVLLVTMEYAQEQMEGPPFAVHEDEVRQLHKDRFAVELLYSQDILEESPRFREKGLTSLAEKVYRLDPRGR